MEYRRYMRPVWGIPDHIGRGSEDIIYKAYSEELEAQGRSLAEWLDIKYTQAAMTDEDLRCAALHSVEAFVWLMPSWSGSEYSPCRELPRPYQYGHFGTRRSSQERADNEDI